MFKYCMIGTLCAVALPCLIMAYRNQEQPEWNNAAPDLLKKLAKERFQPNDEETGEDKKNSIDCCVCMETFEPGVEIIKLSCNVKHVFHEACVTRW